MKTSRFILLAAWLVLLTGCGRGAAFNSETVVSPEPISTGYVGISEEAIINDTLSVERLAQDVYVFTHRYPWPANILVVEVGERERVMVGTPYTPAATIELLAWMDHHLGKRNLAAINTGYHVDNLGGNEALLEAGIPIYGSDRTADLLLERGEEARGMMVELLKNYENRETWVLAHQKIPYLPPDHTFPLQEGLELSIADQKIVITYPGPSHAPDNVVVYFPTQRVLYGGCILVAKNGKPNTDDADLAAWPTAVEKLMAFDAEFVIPTHFQNYDPSIIEGTLTALGSIR